jgi:hypothetical protein
LDSKNRGRLIIIRRSSGQRGHSDLCGKRNKVFEMARCLYMRSSKLQITTRMEFGNPSILGMESKQDLLPTNP